MDNEFPPRELVGPTLQKRKKEKSRPVPLSKELLARKSEIARVLGTKVDQLDMHLRSLTEEQRRTIFYKITHEGPLKITGIGLKPLTDRSESITLAVPTSDDLHSFKEKIQAFADDIPKNDRVKHQELARIEVKFPRNSGRSKKSVNYSEEKQHEQKAIEFKTQTYPAVIYQ